MNGSDGAGLTTFVTYTVMPGDSLWKIAARYYGDGKLWWRIYRDNAAVIQNPGRIYKGQVFRVCLTEAEAPESGSAGENAPAAAPPGIRHFRKEP